MNLPWDVITLLESDNSRLAKESIILSEAENNNDIFFKGCHLALNNIDTFGIKQVLEKSGDGPGLSWDDFYDVAVTFIDRTCTGNAARNAILNLMDMSTEIQWNNWYRRILIKDLRCNVSEKTINNSIKKKYPQYSIPVFTCQLAKDSNNHLGKLSGKWLLDSKLDGSRLLTIVYPNGKVDQFSRNGKEIVNFPHIKEQLSMVASSFNKPMVLDGEIMSSSFQDLMKQLRRKENVETKESTLYVFDMLPLEAFQQGIFNTAQHSRSSYLRLWHSEISDLIPNIQLLEQELVDFDTEAGQARYEEINRAAIEGGFEGIMIKNPNAPYVLKRSDYWLKKKPVMSVDLTIIGLQEGTGKNAGMLGAMVCEGIDQGRKINVNVGSGLTDEQRNDFWMNQSELIGQTVEILADAVTQSQDSETYSLRFPRFLRFRDDK